MYNLKSKSIVILIFIPFIIFGEVIISKQSGLWQDVNTWENGTIPKLTDTITILNTHEIEISNQEVSSKIIHLYGNIKFTKNDGRLNCDSVITWNNSSINGTSTAQSNIRSMMIMGSFNLGRGHFSISNLKINAPISLNNNLGNVTIQNLNISNTGIWNNLSSKTCTIHKIENKGKMLTGNGKYFLSGTIRTEKLIIFNSVELTNNLNNFDSIEVKSQIIGNQNQLINHPNSYFASGTTVGNFIDVILNLKAPNNTFVLNRNSFQTIPTPLDNHFENLILDNVGNVNWTDELAYQIKKITIGEKSVVILNLNRLNSPCKTIVKGEVQTFFSSNEQILNHLENYNYTFESNALWKWNIIDTVFINHNFNCANLQINANSPAWIKGNDIEITINGNINLHQNIRWYTSNVNINLNGSWIGNGIFNDEKSKLKFKNQSFVNISITHINDIEFENIDSIRFLWNTNINNLTIKNSKAYLRSLNCENLNINQSSEIYISGLNNNIQNINNHGFISFTGSNSQNVIENIKNDINAIWKVFNGGNFTIEKKIENEGLIVGCDGTNCNWNFSNTDTLFIMGNGKIYTPRVKSNVGFVVNENFWDISREARGKTTIINKDTIGLGANSNLIEWEINGENTTSTILFNREGVQNIKAEKISGHTNIGFLNGGRKTIENNITINGNVFIANGCEVYLDTFKLKTTAQNSTFLISDSASLTIGKINSNANSGFPKGFKEVNLNINSTVRYQSNGNQKIQGGINYGNIELNCGSVDSVSIIIQDGIFQYSGNLNLQKSAINLIIQQDSAIFRGNWLGVGNVHLINTNLHFYGDGLNTGKLWMDNSKVWYKGDKNQRVKIANYSHMIIDKTNNSKALTRGELGVLNIKKVWVKKGIFSLQTEETYITDSLVIWDKVEIGNTLQNKHLYNITIHHNGILENLINEDLFFYGNLINNGTMILDSGKVIFKGNQDIEWNNNGKCNLGKIVIENPKTTLRGDNFYFSNEIINAQRLYFNNATVNFDSLAFFDSPKYSTDAKSVFKGKKYLDKGNIFKTWGWGIELQLDSNSYMGNTLFEQKFDSENLSVNNPLPYYYIINTESEKYFNVQMSIDVKKNIEDIEEYKIVKSIDDGFSFFEVPSTYSNQKFIVKDIQEFSWWLGAKGETTLLNVELIDFKITPDFISWEVLNTNDIEKYVWRVINFEYDTMWIAEKNVTTTGKNENFYYEGNNPNGYYQLYSIDTKNNYIPIKGAFYFLRVNRNDTNFVRLIDNELIMNQNADKIYCYSINGKLIDFCEYCEKISIKNLPSGIYICKVFFQNNQWSYKISK